MGTFIYWQLKRWAKYQHGNKNRWWIYHRYFHDKHFTDTRNTAKGIEVNRLYRIAYVPIRYHVKVKASANPFLCEYDKYFIQRAKWREDLAKETSLRVHEYKKHYYSMSNAYKSLLLCQTKLVTTAGSLLAEMVLKVPELYAVN